VDRHQLMKETESCWFCDPICTSVVIIFWQRYLCKLADHLNKDKSHDSLCIESADLILQFMPLKADRVLPGELHKVLRSCGWTPAASLLSWTCTSWWRIFESVGFAVQFVRQLSSYSDSDILWFNLRVSCHHILTAVFAQFGCPP